MLLFQEAKFLDYLTGDHTLSSRLVSEHSQEGRVALSQSAESAIPQEHRNIFPQLNITSAFPPTYLIHGSEDSAVILHESETMERKLKGVGVECELIVVEGAEHGFDLDPTNPFISQLRGAIPWIKRVLNAQ